MAPRSTDEDDCLGKRNVTKTLRLRLGEQALFNLVFTAFSVPHAHSFSSPNQQRQDFSNALRAEQAMSLSTPRPPRVPSLPYETITGGAPGLGTTHFNGLPHASL